MLTCVRMGAHRATAARAMHIAHHTAVMLGRRRGARKHTTSCALHNVFDDGR